MDNIEAPIPEIAPEAQAPVAPIAQPAPEAQLVNLRDPDTGQIGSLPADQVPDALNQGFTQVSNEEVKKFVNKQKYGTAAEMAKTALEGVGVGATLGLSTGVERAAGVKAEDILGRREESPILHGVSEALGLVGSSLAMPQVGAGSLITKAGARAAEAVGLGAAETALSKIGSGAVKNAVETMMVQGGNEISKALASDPNQSFESAMTDVGLSGLLGGGIGAGLGSVSPLWDATVGPKVSSLLDAMSKKAGGIEGVLPSAMEESIAKAGMNLSPEIRASLSKDPQIQQMFQTLQESTTASGIQAQQALKTFRSDAADALVGALGKNPAELEILQSLSEADSGRLLQKTLADELKAKIDPISKQFEQVRERFSRTELPEGTRSNIATKIGELADKEGYNLSPSSDQYKEISRVLKELPNAKTLEDLRKYQSIIGDNTSKPELYRVGGQLKKIIRSEEEELVTRSISKDAPEMLLTHGEARAAYKQSMDLIDDLNDRLHVGRYGGPDSFVKALKEMSPEDVLRRLSGKGDADLLTVLQERFPQAASQVKEFQLSALLKNASMKAGEGQSINTKSLFNAIDKMSPELKSFVISPEGLEKINSVKAVMDALPSKMNTSGTAKALDALWSKIPNSGIAMASMLTGHNPVMSMLLAPLTKWMGRDIPDAVRLGMLKFIGSGKQIEASGFKSMVEFIQHAVNGESLINKATKGLFKAGLQVLPQSQMPTPVMREKLDKQLKAIQTDPSSLLKIGGKMPHYLPEQGMAAGQMAASASNYLNSLRPMPTRPNPLDTEIPPSKMQVADYNRALDIAEQPLVVLNHIKEGTLTPQDVTTLRTIYPNLYNKLNEKMMTEMVNHIGKGEDIPYKTRLNMSLFMGQPLDSTMTPQAILAAQPMAQGKLMQPPEAKHSMAALSKMGQQDMTPQQSREANRARR